MKKQKNSALSDLDERIHLQTGGFSGGEDPDRDVRSWQSREQRHSKGVSVLIILAVVLFFLFAASLLFVVPYDQFRFSPAWVFEHVQQRFRQFYLFLFGENSAFGITVWQYLAVILVGAALAATGAIFQGAFRNVLAGPSTMGVMSGGTLGCLVYVLLFVEVETEATYTTFDLEEYLAAQASATIWTTYQQQICTLIGCFAGVGLIVLIATAAGRGRVSAAAMVISGSVFSNITGQITMIIQYYMLLANPEDERIELLRDLMMGSFDNVTSFEYVLMMGVPILICLAVLLALSGRMNLFSLDEDEAQTMGVNLRPLRIAMIAAGTVLTAVVVSFCGRIGFLGFMIPLVGRKLVGPDMRRLLPASLLLGSILLILVFDAAYIAGMTDSLNLFTSTIGSIVMIATLFLRKGGVRYGTSEGTAAP